MIILLLYNHPRKENLSKSKDIAAINHKIAGVKIMNTERCWVSLPNEWQPLFKQWHKDHSEDTMLHSWSQYGSGEVISLTIGAGACLDLEELRRRPFRLLVTVPHAHEPASTAAAVNMASQLLKGTYLDGTPTELPTKEILQNSVITLAPDTNSQGRARSPYRYWDGRVDLDTLRKHMRGLDRHGGLFGRYPEWRFSEHKPQQVGIVYEQIDEDLFVEPNTSIRSTHTRLVDELFAVYGYTHMLEMHQHAAKQTILLPPDFGYLTAEDQKRTNDWGLSIIKAWSDAGDQPNPVPHVPYLGQERHQFLLHYWEGRCPGMLHICTEVLNNISLQGTKVTIEWQLKMALLALETTVRMGLNS
jgi:hypothetical protein